MATLESILQTIEYILGVNGKYIYTLMGANQKTYSALRTGRRKGARIEFYEKYKAALGIDLYQSMQRGEIVVMDGSKLPEKAYEILVTNGPVKIGDVKKRKG